MTTARVNVSIFLLLASAACTGSTQSAPDTEPTVTADPSTPSTTDTATAPPDANPPQKICTMIGCESGLVVDLPGAKAGTNPFTKGTYTIEVASAGSVTKCEVKLPLAACDKGPSVKCTGDVKVQVTESGCALPADAHSLGPLRFPDAPAELEILVKKDKKLIGEGKLKPTYKTAQPNGPDCDPICNQASETIRIGG